jgi:hypothetical protein
MSLSVALSGREGEKKWEDFGRYVRKAWEYGNFPLVTEIPMKKVGIGLLTSTLTQKHLLTNLA